MDSSFKLKPTKRFWVAMSLMTLPLCGCAKQGMPRNSFPPPPINPASSGGFSDSSESAKSHANQHDFVPLHPANSDSQTAPSHAPVVVAQHQQTTQLASENQLLDWEGHAAAIENFVQPASTIQAERADTETKTDAESPKETEESKATDAAIPVQSTVPLEQLVNQALAGHPKLLAARQRVAAATNVIPQAGALPDPAFNNTFWPLHDNALQTAGGRVANQMSLYQSVPFPEKLRAKVAIASGEVRVAQAEVESLEREVEKAVRLSYYEVWYNDRALAIIDESKSLVEELVTIAKSRFRTGGSQQDVLRAELEADRLLQQRISIVEKQQLAMADLATLLQQPTNYEIKPTEKLQPEDVTSQLDELIDLAQQCNPKLRGLAAEVQRDRQRQRLACLQQYPDFNVGLNWGIISDNHDVISPVADGNDNLSITFGTTLPIWRDKINAGVREAAHRTSSTSQRLSAERDELFGKIRRLLAQADALSQQRALFRDRLIPRTEDALELTIADYGGNRTEFFSVIDTYRELLTLEMQLVRLDASLAGTIAEIDSIVGCSP